MNMASMHFPVAYCTAFQHSAPARCGGFSVKLKVPSCNMRKLGSAAMAVNTFFFVIFCDLLKPLCDAVHTDQMKYAVCFSCE